MNHVARRPDFRISRRGRRLLSTCDEMKGLGLVHLDRLTTERACRDVLLTQWDHRDEEQRKPGRDPNNNLSGWRSALAAQGEHSGESSLQPFYCEDNEHHLAFRR